MKPQSVDVLIRRLCRLAGGADSAELTDAELLERWACRRDEAAFEVLLWRHGPMVLGVCRRLLCHAQDVEDAFQATFLVLVRKAGAIRRRGLLATWLYKVAFRVALRARSRRPHVPLPAEPAASEDPDACLLWRDLRPVLDEEVHRLPEKYRTPFILCYLQGKSNREAAECLGCPVGTVQSRLAWAREKLRGRLTRRGLALSLGTLTAALDGGLYGAPLPTTLCRAAMRTARAGAVPDGVALLTKGVVTTMLASKLKFTAAVALTVAILGAGAGLAIYPTPGGEEPVGGQRPTPPTGDEGDDRQPPGGRRAKERHEAARQAALKEAITELKQAEKRLLTEEAKWWAELVSLRTDVLEAEEKVRRIDRDEAILKEATLQKIGEIGALRATDQKRLRAKQQVIRAEERLRQAEILQALKRHGLHADLRALRARLRPLRYPALAKDPAPAQNLGLEMKIDRLLREMEELRRELRRRPGKP